MKERITLGLMIDQLVSGYARRIIDGVSSGSRSQDANLIVFSGRVLGTPHAHDYQNNVIFDFIRKGTVDALVMATGAQGSYLALDQFLAYMGRFKGIPLVSLGIRVEGLPCVLTDNRSGILEAIDHLVDVHGLRRIAFLKGPENNQEAQERFTAYREALRSRGLEEDPALWIPGDFTRAGARRMLSEYGQGQGKPDFQALVAANDEMAIGALEALRERGCSIPRDVAVIGFDNIQDAQFVLPSLTTVGQLLVEQARRAATIAAAIARGHAVPSEVVLPARLVLRTSCGCLPQGVAALDSLPARPRTGTHVRDTAKVIRESMLHFPPDLPSQPLDAVRGHMGALVEKAGTSAFLDTLHQILNEEVAAGIDITAWQLLLPGLQGELVSSARSSREVATLQTQFQKSLVLLSEMLRLEQGKALSELQGHMSQLRRVTERLTSVATVEALMNDCAAELDLLDIGTCFIACYAEEKRHHRGEPWVVPDRAEAALAWVNGERVAASGADRVFSPADRFIPLRYLPAERRCTLITTALFFREDQIGYIAFEPGLRDYAIYETFCVQLSSLLNSSLLFAARQRVHDALERERALVAILMETLPDRIYFKDEHSRFVLINPSMARALGVEEPSQAYGRTDFDYFTAQHAQPAFDGEQEIIRTGEPVVDLVEEETWRDGRSTWVSTTKMPLRDGKGNIIGTFGISRDITERLHSEARLIQAQRLESLGTLAGGIAHQFNNINAVIKGYLDALLESPGISVLVRSYGEEAMKGVGRLVDITERLQGLTAPSETGAGTCRLHLLARSLLDELEKRLDDMKVTVDLFLEETPPVQMHFSRARFIMVSLLDNSLHAMLGRAVRTLTVRTGTDDGSAFLEIHDTGCGIPREDIPRLFTPFFTTKGEWAASNSPQAKVKGVGLSLSISRSTVSESGGRIEVESEPDEGATFRVWLPTATP